MKHKRTRSILGAALPAGLLFCGASPDAAAQGCVAVRSFGSPTLACHGSMTHEEPWQAIVAYRYLYADRYFQGKRELSNMPGMSPGDQVINEIHTWDVAVSYTFNHRLTITADLPYVYGERTSREEHLGMDPSNPQHTTRAHGIGDLRITADWWLFDPKEHKKGNIALGIGIKAPTGSDDEEDDFVQPGGVVERPVDVAIQPGDGGWGIILQGQAFQEIVPRLAAYANAFYLVNPREVNGTRSFSDTTINNDDVNSVPDQYLGRAGLNYVVWPKAGLSVSLGGRIEGIPVNDLIGADEGFRRPGYVISVEPGVNWMYQNHNLSVTVPVAVEINRQRSETDQRLPGRMYAGAFADWTLFASYSLRF
jgi:hypothetical protein